MKSLWISVMERRSDLWRGRGDESLWLFLLSSSDLSSFERISEEPGVRNSFSHAPYD
jgi:hypothetical protein